MHIEDAYLFRHAVMRDASYQLQLPRDRAGLHGIAAELLGQLAESAEDAFEVAYHYRLFSESDPSGFQSEVYWLERSYLRASTHHRHDIAIRSLARLIEHPLTEDSERAQLMHDLLDAAQKGSSVAHIREWLPRARLIAQRDQHPRLELRIAVLEAELRTAAGDGSGAIELMQRAIGKLNQADAGTRARAWGQLGNLAIHFEQAEVARNAFAKASEFAQKADDRQLDCAVALSRVPLDCAPDAQVEALKRCVDGFRAIGDIRGEARALSDLATATKMAPAQARPFALRALELQRTVGFRRGEAVALLLLSYLYRGEPQSVRYAREALLLRREIEDVGGMAKAATVLAMMLAELGEHEEEQQTLKLAHELSARAGNTYLHDSLTRQLKREPGI